MPAGLIALLVFVVVALLAFGMGSILDQRNARARLIKERLSNERKAPELAPDEELALLRDEQLSQIPALDELRGGPSASTTSKGCWHRQEWPRAPELFSEFRFLRVWLPHSSLMP